MKDLGRVLMLVFMFSGFCFTKAQQNHSLSEIESKLSQSPKNLVIKFSTNWCGVCSIQKQKIEKNEELKKFLNESFYYLEFDAESKEDFIFAGNQFKAGKGKMHEFTELLLNGNPVYPAWVILNSDLEIIFQYQGLLETHELISIFEQIL